MARADTEEFEYHEETVPLLDDHEGETPYPPRQAGTGWVFVERVVIDKLVVYRWRRTTRRA